VDFLQKHKVLPVPAPDLPFLPLPLIVESKRRKLEIKEQPAERDILFDCWEKIQDFETFAIMIGLPEPIFMPFTTLPKPRELAEPFLNNFFNDSKLLPQKLHKAFLIDCNQPAKDIANHLTAWLNYFDVREAVCVKEHSQEMNAKDDKSSQKRESRAESSEYLTAVDFYLKNHKNDRDDERRIAVDFVKEYFPKEYKKSKDRNYAQTRFVRWLNAGNNLVKNYKAII